MKDKIHVDVGIGDVVEPQHREIKLFEYRGKPFFEESISLLVYPIETIFAEKLETVLSKGSKNSRMKDVKKLLYCCEQRLSLPPGINVRISSKNVLSFRVRFRKNGYPDQIKAFPDEDQAKIWLAKQQHDAFMGIHFPEAKVSQQCTLAEAINWGQACRIAERTCNTYN